MPWPEFHQLAEDCAPKSNPGLAPFSRNPYTPSMALHPLSSTHLERSIHNQFQQVSYHQRTSLHPSGSSRGGMDYCAAMVIPSHNNLSFKCESCNKSFTTKGNLTRHKNSTKGCEWGILKEYRCEFCQEVFKRSDKCADHELKMHGLTHRSRRPRK